MLPLNAMIQIVSLGHSAVGAYVPILSPVFSRVLFGAVDDSRRSFMNPTDPVVAARCLQVIHARVSSMTARSSAEPTVDVDLPYPSR